MTYWWKTCAAAIALLALIATACGGSTAEESVGEAADPVESVVEAAPDPDGGSDDAADQPDEVEEPEPTAVPETEEPDPTPEPDPEPTATPDPDRDGDGVLDVDDDFPDDPDRSVGIEPLWPIVDGVLQVPDLPSTRAIEWVRTVAFAPDVTDEQLAERLAPSFLAAVDPDTFRSVTGQVRPQFPNGWQIVDARILSEWSTWVAIGDPSRPQQVSILRLELDPNTEMITQLEINPWGPGVEAASFTDDRNLTMDEVFASLGDTAEFVSAVVARVGDAECEAIGGLDANVPLATGSIYKQWVLGAAAQAVADGEITRSDTVAFVPGEYFAIGSRSTAQFESPFDLTVQQTANLMMNQSDNGATDVMEELLGRPAIDAFVLESGHTDPSLLVPMLGVRDYNHLFTSVPPGDVDRYLDELGDSEQEQYLVDTIDVLGVDGLNLYGNVQRIREYTWRASPLDICNTMARLRTAHPIGSDAAHLIDEAYSGETFWFGLRPEWDRVWMKGGGIPGPTPGSAVVQTYASMVESNEHGAYAVIIMFNDSAGLPGDQLGFAASSLGARLHRLLLDMR